MTKIPRPPKFLGSEGRKFWRQVAEKWDLQPHEEQLLAFAAGCLDTIALAREALAREGPITKSERGRLIVNPAVKAIRDERAEFRLLVGRLKLATGGK